MSETIYLGLGSNIGDRLGSLAGAVEALERREVRLVRSSRVYETDPVGGPPQPVYLNAVIEVETELEPRHLLRVCLEVENELGRVREERWGPRTMDIDILTYGDRDIFEADLVIPHPRMHERAFVLVPLLELDADPPLPGGREAETLSLGADALTAVRPYAPPLRYDATTTTKGDRDA